MDNLKGQYFKKTGKLLNFSEQILMGCDVLDNGCNGGLLENVFTWMKNSGGIILEEDYPYTARKGTCKMDSSKFVKDAVISSYKKLGDCGKTFCPVDEKEVKTFLLQTGPLAVELNANLLHKYRSGFIDEEMPF